jgi:hypothetical protein
MTALPDLLARLLPSGTQFSPAVAMLLPFHIVAGMICVIAGALAALSRKGPGRHPSLGGAYFWALAVLFVSSTAISLLRWPRDTHLLAMGVISFVLASVGYVARKVHWPGWTTVHVLGMGLSYVVLLTAFYVDNGPHLPVWNRLPSPAFWIGPSLIGLPLVALGLGRHARAIDDLRLTATFLKRRMAGR